MNVHNLLDPIAKLKIGPIYIVSERKRIKSPPITENQGKSRFFYETDVHNVLDPINKPQIGPKYIV